MTSISAVAKKAGVSQATVSYVLNNKPGVSAQTTARIKRIIKELNYVPRASRTRSGLPSDLPRSCNIALLIPEGCMSLSQLNTQLFEALHTQLEEKKLRLHPIRLPKGADTAQIIASHQASTQLNGIILFYYATTASIGDSSKIPMVTILGHPASTEPLVCDHIEPDNVRIGALAAKHLKDSGHNQIAVINPSTAPHTAVNIRCKSFLEAADTLGTDAEIYDIPLELSAAESLAYITSEHPLSLWIEQYKALCSKPTGIFVPSDSHLAIVFNAFKRAGIEPGEDVDFIGCNNESMLLQGLSPTPATIDILPEEIARTAIHFLLQRIAHKVETATHTTAYIDPALIKQ